jgi:hypothetical protein
MALRLCYLYIWNVLNIIHRLYIAGLCAVLLPIFFCSDWIHQSLPCDVCRWRCPTDSPSRVWVLTAPHSPRRHQKLNLRMKSFSLDESGEHFHHHGSMSVGATMGHHSQGCGPPHGHHRLTHHRSSNPNAATTTTTSSSGTLNSNSAHNSQASFYCQCNFYHHTSSSAHNMALPTKWAGTII